MDWLLKHNLIKQYLQTNFKQKEFRRAVKYTLIIGIQTLYQLHGNSTTNPHVSFTLEQLASMIVSNNGTIQVQSDLPALNQCLKDIKSQLGDIQNELDHTKSSSNSKPITIESDSQKFVGNIPKVDRPKPRKKSATNKNKRKSVKNKKILKKADSKWRVGDTQKFKATKHGSYPSWWPKDDEVSDDNDYYQHNEQKDVRDDNDEEYREDETQQTQHHQHGVANPPHAVHPHIYNQPIAFSIPKDQFDKTQNDNNIVQLHVNLYPEYLQKCLDPNSESKIKSKIMDLGNEYNEIPHRPRNKKRNNKKNRSKSLTRCTESSQARTIGIRPQSAFLKANNRNVAPCLKYQKKSVDLNQRSVPNNMKKRKQKKKQNQNRRKSLPNKSNKVPRYLQNVESRIKKELRRDKIRNNVAQNEKKSFLRDVARYGLDENKNDEYIDEWREKFGYERLGSDEISKPSAISVADAIMQSNVIQAMDPSLNKRPTLITGNLIDMNNNHETDTFYDQVINNGGDTNDSMNMNFLSELREWASGLTENNNDSITNDLNVVDSD